MDDYLHTKEVNRIKVTGDFNAARLTAMEQLGLYLLGQISTGELAELWDVSRYQVIDTVCDVIRVVEGLVGERVYPSGVKTEGYF